MTAIARTLRGHLTQEAFDALHLTAEWAADHEQVLYTHDPLCRLSVLIQLLAHLDGTWQDVLDLAALHDDFVDEFLNPFHAATVWGFAVEHYRLTVPERTAA